jgi:Putative beta-barrel porin-2, OmpL-like. bbp2
MRLPKTSLTVCLAAAACLAGYMAAPADAQTAAPAAPAPTAPATAAPAPAASGTAAAPTPATPAAPPPGLWINGIHLYAQIQGGMTINPAYPDDGVNFGRLFDDRSNMPVLNQLMLTATKPLNSSATGFDWGFKLQGIYGADARYTHFLGVFDQNPGPGYENQFDIFEADVQLHLPFPTAGGMDMKIGMYPTPLGYEGLDPSGNPFYSHSYIFNFGLPFKHTGILTTSHLTPLVDFYLGIDTGVNTTFGCCNGDNNGVPGGIVGFGLNMMGGNLTLVALSHMGPENPSRALEPLGFNANSYMRYLNDVVLTWKVNSKLTLVTEANLIRDDFAGFYTKGVPSPANAFGVAQYFEYSMSDTVTFNARAEIYRDDNGFFVTAFPANNVFGFTNFVRSELGLPSVSVGTGVPTTYGEITLGLTFKPNLPAPVTGLLIRPELRVDSALSGGRPFGSNFNGTSQVTVASDFVLTF